MELKLEISVVPVSFGDAFNRTILELKHVKAPAPAKTGFSFISGTLNQIDIDKSTLTIKQDNNIAVAYIMSSDTVISYDGTILVISHDRYFLNKVINKIYELKIEGLKEYLGNYSYYVEKKKNPLRFQEEEEKEGKSKTQIQSEKKKKRDEEKSEKEVASKLKNIEKGISDLELDLSNFQNSLCLEEVYSNPQKCLEVNSQITDAKSMLENLYQEWEEMI